MNKQIEKVICNLEKNNMKGYYAATKQDVCNIVSSLLFDGCTITSGGSVSLKESGVFEILCDNRYKFYDRSKPDITPEEKMQIFKQSIGCDFFFCSSNAVTEDGVLINVDGMSNRISAIAFGPKNVIMIVGSNKIVKDVREGQLRVKTIAAPMNVKRLNIHTPCYKLGHCIALENNSNPDFTDGCMTDNRICCNYLVSARQKVKNRIKVIICEEELGY